MNVRAVKLLAMVIDEVLLVDQALLEQPDQVVVDGLLPLLVAHLHVLSVPGKQLIGSLPAEDVVLPDS